MSNKTTDDVAIGPYQPIDSSALPIAVESALMKVISPSMAADKKDATYYKKKAKANNTYRSYASAIRDYVNWTQHPNPFPTTHFMIERYLIEMANAVNDSAVKDPQQTAGDSYQRKYAPSTISHRLAAISWIHRMLGFDDPTQNTQIRTLLSGIRIDCMEAGWQEQQAPALSFDALRGMLSLMGDSRRDYSGPRFSDQYLRSNLAHNTG